MRAFLYFCVSLCASTCARVVCARALARDCVCVFTFVSSHPAWPHGQNGNLLSTEYGLCVYQNHQTITVQEVMKPALSPARP